MKEYGPSDYRVMVDDQANDAYVFEIVSQERVEIEELHSQKFRSPDWSENLLRLQDYDVFPFGDNNDLPLQIRETLSRNHLAPRVMKKKKLLNTGKGPMLYRPVIEKGQISREWVEDRQVQDWLDSFAADRYLDRCMTDYNYAEICWTKVIASRRSRLGRPFVNRLEHVPVGKARYGRLAGSLENSPPTVGIVGKWNHIWSNPFEVYPLTDWRRMRGQSLFPSYSYSFETDYYTRPDVLGVLPWLRRSSAIPFTLEALSRNSLNVKYHVKSPKEYWDQLRERMEEEARMKGEPLSEKAFEAAKDEKFRNLGKVLASEKNVGKFFTSEVVTTIIGGDVVKLGWEIEPIEQNIKEFVDAQLSISKRSDFAAIAAMGLHAALSNISSDGKSDSGSEQLYALQNYLLTEVSGPENHVTDALNKALAINFPGKNIRIGFYHDHPKREEDKSAGDRIKNQPTA